jgi:hypothetical protein
MCKIKIKKEDDKGRIKTLSEQYLIDAVSFTDAEKRLHEQLSTTHGEFHLANVSRSSVAEVHLYDDSDVWNRCKICYVSIDEAEGRERKITTTMLLTANDIRTAFERVQHQLRSMIVDYEIPEIAQVPILDVFAYNELPKLPSKLT